MSQSHTLFMGMDGHTEAIAVASVAHEPGAEVTSRGALGTRQCAIEPLRRQRPSQATHLVFISDARPLWGLALSLSHDQRRRLRGRGALSAAHKGRGPRQHGPPGRRARGEAGTLGGPPPGVCLPGGG